MESSGKDSSCEMDGVSRAMLSDAGAWLARMNGPLRTPAVEEGFRQWLRDHPLHGRAFRLLTEDWEAMDELKPFAQVLITAPGSQAVNGRRASRASGLRLVFLAAAVVLLGIFAGLFYYSRSAGVATAVGEQRIVTLQDGTKVYLNTATHIGVQYGKKRRGVRLDSGEALFEVAQHSGWPFVVTVGERTVTALGTSFVVRKDPDERVAITLVEGKVAVSRVPSLPSIRSEISGTPAAGTERPVTLVPGQRLILKEHAPAVIDRPEINEVTSWQQGKVAIDNMRLSEAVVEMNRYSTLKLVIERPESEQLLLSGVFTAGQSASFARAVAQSYGLKVVEDGNTLVLAGLARVPD